LTYPPALQRQIDARSADMDAVKEIRQQSEDAVSLIANCSASWTNIHTLIYDMLTDTEGISTLLPTTELTVATKDNITGELQTMLKSLQELHVEVCFPFADTPGLRLSVLPTGCRYYQNSG
jgi:hypothetical protein